MAQKNQQNVEEDEEMDIDRDQDGGFYSDEEGGLRIDDEIYIPPRPTEFGEVDTTGPRLMITHIHNVNFKSYAGEQTVGPFHKCFSAIVGPNGSGKSNVIDSLLFVFGYRASKIRSKKISVLIHNSSEHLNVKSCTVSIHFQQIIDKEGDDYEIVPNSQFVISRTAFKDSSSYYQLDGRKVIFKEIAKLLRSHGVDLDHNRFLILQGEVEQIALMKPKGQGDNDTGLLEFLEDIIGTNRYKEPLEKLNEKVEIMTDRRTEKLHRLRLVEKEKKDLEEPMQDAVQFLKCENSIIKYQHQLYHRKRYDAKIEFDAQEKNFAEQEKDYNELMEKMKKIQEEKIEKQKEFKERSKKWEKLQNDKDAKTTEFDEIRKQDQALQEELVETNNRRKKNRAAVKTEMGKLEELQRVPEKNAKDIEEYEELIKKSSVEREKEEETLKTMMSSLKEKTEPLLKERVKQETALIELRKKVDEAKSAFDIAQSELQLYTSEEEKEKGKLQQLQEALTSTTETLEDRRKQLGELEREIPATQKSIAEVERKLDDLKTREAEVTQKLRTKRVQFDEQQSSMKASHSRNLVLGALMTEKRKGRITGIFGRLGDLGAIDAKYDVAISTACGPLDNIVVDTVSTAEMCIKHLRDNDLGRATFIPLEKQQRFAQQCRQRIQTPEQVPRLFDLIQIEDERLRPAFFYALQNTLVAEDLDQATRIAYGSQRHRVVTLRGELIEVAGTMSGGGRTSLRGRMGQRVVRNEPNETDVEQLKAELDQLFANVNQLKMEQTPLENQHQTLVRALREMEVTRDRFKLELKNLIEQEPLLQQQLKEQEKKTKNSVSNPQRVKELTKSVESAEQRLQTAEESSSSTEEKVAKINQEIDIIAGNRVKVQQKKIAELTKTIDKANGEVVRLNVAIKTAARTTTKTEQRIATLETDVTNCEQRILAAKQEKEKFEEIGKQLLKDLKELNEQLQERDEATAEQKEALSVLQTNESELKSKKIDFDQKISELKKKILEIGGKIPEYGKRIRGLKLHKIPESDQEELIEPTQEELDNFDEKIIQQNLQRAKEKLPEEIPNMQYIKDYQEKDRLYLERAAELDVITTERNNLRDIYEGAKRRRMEEFRNGFKIITTKLKEMYQMITLGGDAELELVDSLDPFSEGIVFSVRPPKKSWKNISNLSGGEKTLSSLALIFALHHYKPTPFYFMDEIDAALDFKNVSIVGNYIKERTKNAQFIVISLRFNMFELANYLVGIYKTYNCTKCATLEVNKAYKHHGIAPPVQLNNMTQQKNRYLTQSQKMSQPSINEQDLLKSVDGLQQVATCSDHNEMEENCDKGENNAVTNVPDLELCPTPRRNSEGRERRSLSLSELSEGDNEENSFINKTDEAEEPTPKKRRLQRKRTR
ncbi:structural maintenance of chromosomes protein 4 [Leptopilina heterotoma]|uniref:structural maintenance of chromosomes protein 4 n=1 Tax=Leptopilina heterotoma TaxID=63436 RepID=UPI001CA8DC31|nr:structural maintenance of chromosomes protein 4 [Leptopilina heterotoma]